MHSAAAIQDSPAFGNWRDAFRQTAGIEVHLLDGADLETNLHRATGATALCGQLRGRCGSCDECLQRFCNRLRASGANHAGPFAMRCHAGLTVTALPVRLADEATAFLFTGPVLLNGGTKPVSFESVVEHVASNGSGIPRAVLAEAARHIPVRDKQQFNAAITLMRLLAEQLAHMSRQLLSTPDRGIHEAYVIRRACELINRRFAEALRLDEVAHEIGVSRSYFSHLFHRLTGLTFTRYLSARRVVEVKRLLTDSELRITEILFAAGFQSLSQGNRVFRTATGMSPRDFRARHLG